jgi:hypothetical protein
LRTSAAAIPVTNGQGIAVWEWVGPPLQGTVQTPEFGALLAMATNPNVTPATATVNLSLGPRSTDQAPLSGGFIPRFLDTSTALAFLSVR